MESVQEKKKKNNKKTNKSCKNRYCRIKDNDIKESELDQQLRKGLIYSYSIYSIYKIGYQMTSENYKDITPLDITGEQS